MHWNAEHWHWVIPFQTNVLFYTPCKHPVTTRFLKFSGGIKREHGPIWAKAPILYCEWKGLNLNFKPFLANIYLFNVNNRTIGKGCEICLKLTLKTPERRHWRKLWTYFTTFSSASIFEFDQVNFSWVSALPWYNDKKYIQCYIFQNSSQCIKRCIFFEVLWSFMKT